MHQALEIDEIIRLICEQLQLGDITSARRDLLYLALTCKTIKKVALDQLWDSNTEVPHVFHPFIVWEILRQDDDCLELNRHATYLDWRSYEIYAARITKVIWDSRSKISERACIGLLASCPRTTIFPRIRHLDVSSSSGTEFLISRIFHSHSLHSLSVDAETLEACAILPSFLANIGFCSVNLQKLTLSVQANGMEGSDLERKVASSFASILQLREFSLDASSSFIRNLFELLPQLTHLCKLSIRSSRSGEEIASTPPRPVGLAGLIDLSFVSRYTDVDLGTIGQFIKLAPLKTVDIMFGARFGAEVVGTVLKSLHGCLWNRLECLELRADGGWSDVSESPITGVQLQVLSHPTFAYLKKLEIGGFFAFDLTDAELELLGWRCPLLESLHFRSYIPEPPQAHPNVTFAGLISLGRILSNLKALTLPVMIDPANVIREPEAQTSALVSWDPSYSFIENPFVAGSLLLYYFPHLESVEPHPRIANVNWDAVVSGNERRREMERKWIRSGQGFQEIHEFIQAAVKIRKSGESTRDVAKRLFG
ncbi:hypothetical protein FRC03_001192 [Tulasnella sp. 419]|nr:hypothetical protein FRC03_001192 [Tulasnella sp. 419]